MTSFRLLPITLLAILIALTIAGWSAYQGFLEEERNRLQAALSTSVLNDLRRTEAALLDAETGQRGYILTGQDEYLAPYESGRASFPEAYASLTSRLQGIETPRQRAALERLELLGENKLAELAETISLNDSGDRAASLELIKSNLGKDIMDEVRVLVHELIDEEQVILASSLKTARDFQSRTATILLVCLAMVLALVGALAYMFVRSERLNRTEDLLAQVTKHRDRSVLLAQELSHRTKNLFGIVNSIVRMTGRSETDTKVAIKKISDRISALSRAHSLATTSDADADVELEDLIRITLEPYTTGTRTYAVSGDSIRLNNACLTPLGLILHELATNALKYGAWSESCGGHIGISWTALDPQSDNGPQSAELVWNEVQKATAPAATASVKAAETNSSGFGTRMIETSIQQLKGKLHKQWEDGLIAKFSFEIPSERTVEAGH